MKIHVTYSNGECTETDSYVKASLTQVAELAQAKVRLLNGDRRPNLPVTDPRYDGREWSILTFLAIYLKFLAVP